MTNVTSNSTSATSPSFSASISTPLITRAGVLGGDSEDRVPGAISQSLPAFSLLLSPNFPPHPHPDLVDRLSVVRREWRRDNGVWCLEELRRILDDYPWSQEAADLYGLIHSKLHHLFSKKAAWNLHEWISLQNITKMAGKVHRVDFGSERFAVMWVWIKEWTEARGEEEGWGREKGGKREKRERWCRIADIGGQHGEMTVEWVKLAGMERGFVLELSPANCRLGRLHNTEEELEYVCCFGDQIPMRDGSVHISVLSGVLEHVLDVEGMVAEAERITVPGGLIIVQVPYGGMEGEANRESDVLSFRAHVRTVNPYQVIAGKKAGRVAYLDYTNNPNSPHTWVGVSGDYIASWERESNGAV